MGPRRSFRDLFFRGVIFVRETESVALLVIVAAAVIGAGSLLLFLGFLFAGPFRIWEAGFSRTADLLWNSLLSVAFFVQHSAMIRKGARRRLAGIVGNRYVDAAYTVCSGIVLSVVVVCWQSSGVVLYEMSGIYRPAARGVFLIALTGFGWGVKALNSLDAFGLKPVMDGTGGSETGPPPVLTVNGPYRWVRHPLYFFVLILIWACPDITLDRLLFNLLWTLWIYVATVFEERDLAASFGERYRQYQRKTPRLLPWKGPAAG